MSKKTKHNKKTSAKNVDSLKFYDKLLMEEPELDEDIISDKGEDKANIPNLQEGEDVVLLKLRELLFGDEIRKTDNIAKNLINVKSDIGTIQKITVDEKGFEKRLEPHMNQQIQFLRENFSDLFGDHISYSVQRQIKDSKEDIVEAMYPIVGAMIKRYIAKEFKLLNERLERTANQIFKLSFWKTKVRGLITGVDHTEMFLQELYQSKVEDIFIIQKGTGLLIGKYIIENSDTDRDIVAGALTAIKGFAESALGKKSVELEKIDYGGNSILLHNYHKFYFAVMCSGTVGHHFVHEINEKILSFTEQFLSEIPDKIDSQVFKQNSQQLQKHF